MLEWSTSSQRDSKFQDTEHGENIRQACAEVLGEGRVGPFYFPTTPLSFPRNMANQLIRGLFNLLPTSLQEKKHYTNKCRHLQVISKLDLIRAKYTNLTNHATPYSFSLLV